MAMPGWCEAGSGMGHVAGGYTVLTDPGAGFLVWGFGIVTVAGPVHGAGPPDGSQLPGKNQGLGKRSHVYLLTNR